jgi:methylmalonyl-CoA/ethylmalonyl-CoA epimerase
MLKRSFKILRLNHVAIATDDLQKHVHFFSKVLGMKVSERLAQPEHGVYTTFVECGGGVKIELLEELGENSPIQSFLRKGRAGGGGGGLVHHLCIEVDSVKEAEERVKEQGVRVLGEGVKIGAHGRPVIFLHPKDTGGLLIELEEA